MHVSHTEAPCVPVVAKEFVWCGRIDVISLHCSAVVFLRSPTPLHCIQTIMTTIKSYILIVSEAPHSQYLNTPAPKDWVHVCACSTNDTQECDQGRSWVTGYSAGPVHCLGLVRDENTCQLLHNTMVLVLAHPMEHRVEVRYPSLGGLLHHAVIVLTERGGQNSSKDKLPETGGRHGRHWSPRHGGPRFSHRIVQCLVCSVAEDDSGVTNTFLIHSVRGRQGRAQLRRGVEQALDI